MSARPYFSWKSRGAQPARPSPISLSASSGLDPAGYFVEQRLGPGNRDLRNRPRAASSALLLRSGQYGGARMNSSRSFLREIALKETTERGTPFKFVGAPSGRARPSI